MVENGLCVIGSIATALQVKFGYSAATAISKATEALQAAGVVTTPVNGGISVPEGKMAETLTSLGFVVSNITYTATAIKSHFDNGGFGIGHFYGPPAAHDVFLTNHLGSTSFTYWDPVKGHYSSGSPDEIILFFK
jgi:hypothetical protein